MNSSDHIAAATKLIQAGNFDEAEALLAGADDAPAQQLLGVICFQTNRMTEAITYFERATRDLADDGYLQNNLGQAYRAMGDHDAAIKVFGRAAELQVEFADPLNYLGQLQREQGNAALAEQSFNEAINRRPGYAEAHFNLGVLLQDDARPTEAQEQYELALHASPNHVQAYNNLGTVLDELGDHQAAEQCYLNGLELSPETPELLVSLGSCRRVQGRYEEALEVFEKASNIAPDFIEARWNLGFLQLALGNCAEGWANYRYRHSVDRKVHPILQDRLPEDLEGRVIELAAEQGLGDEIYFLRFAQELVARGASITFQPDPKLNSLIRRMADITVGEVGKDAFSIADLPYLLGSKDALPSIKIPPDEAVLAEMQARLAAAGPAPYFGVTYRAGAAGKDTLIKNAPLDGIGDALRGTSATIIDVQRLPTQEEQSQLAATVGREVADFSEINDDLEQALALMSLLDDYVGVSNTNMHLRAAAGKPARVLVTHPGEYRWLVDGDRSPWFPDFDLYRQKPGGSWEGAFAKLASDIKAAHE
tara:strand:+ start:3856 stop:5463 length:1608 start_codon:yes stop_codon:yes gene_type:complete